jgi:hypothetical protein
MKQAGVKGALPLRCLPYWGREGVTLPITTENSRTTKNRISTNVSKKFARILPDFKKIFF